MRVGRLPRLRKFARHILPTARVNQRGLGLTNVPTRGGLSWERCGTRGPRVPRVPGLHAQLGQHLGVLQGRRLGRRRVARAGVQVDQEAPAVVGVGVEPQARADGVDGLEEVAVVAEPPAQRAPGARGGDPQPVPLGDHPLGGALLGQQVAAVVPERRRQRRPLTAASPSCRRVRASASRASKSRTSLRLPGGSCRQ